MTTAQNKGMLTATVDVAASTLAAENLSVATWLKMFPDEPSQLDALVPRTGLSTGPGHQDPRANRIVHAVLRLSLRNLSEEARRLLYAAACFDPASGAPQSLIVAVAEASAQNTASRDLNLLHQRSVLRTHEGRIGGTRYTMHRLMREVVRREADEDLTGYEARFVRVMAAFPQLLADWVSRDKSTDALLAFNQESPNLYRIADAFVEAASIPAALKEELPRLRAEFATHVAQFAILMWPLSLSRRLLEAAEKDAAAQDWAWIHASTLRVLGDLEVREDRLEEARANYVEALPIFREIQDRLGRPTRCGHWGTWTCVKTVWRRQGRTTRKRCPSTGRYKNDWERLTRYRRWRTWTLEQGPLMPPLQDLRQPKSCTTRSKIDWACEPTGVTLVDTTCATTHCVTRFPLSTIALRHCPTKETRWGTVLA